MTDTIKRNENNLIVIKCLDFRHYMSVQFLLPNVSLFLHGGENQNILRETTTIWQANQQDF